MSGITDFMSGTEVEIQGKKELDRIHWNTVQKIIVLLYRNGMMKKTAISMRCRLRYDRFRLHLDWCESLKLVQTKTGNDGTDLICLTDRGTELYRELFAHKQLDF